MTTITTVNLIGSAAPLLSASVLSDCQNAQDPTCQGGVAAVAAHIRHHANTSDPVLVCPRLDRQSEFVQSHPLGWSVNTKVLQDHFGWTVFTAHPSLLNEGNNNNNNQEVSPTRDVSGLQTPQMPLLLTNVDVPPSNSWHPYVESVHLDPPTNLALISLEEEDENHGWSQVESALASLDYVAAQNQRRQCGLLASSMSDLISGVAQEPCWIPVILVYKSTSNAVFDRLVEEATHHDHPPALIVDWEGTQKAYQTPKVEAQEVWIVSNALTQDQYLQYTIQVDRTTQRIHDLMVITDDLLELPPKWRKDEMYANDTAFLRTLADQAMEHDPILSNSNAMPRADTGQCHLEECEIGNLVADALKWKTKADLALVLAQPLTGPGWPFGQVHVSDIFQTLPTPTTICTGQISGRTLLQVLEHALQGVSLERSDDTSLLTSRSANASTIESSQASAFLQVSGLQVVYNSQLPNDNSTNLVSVKVLGPNKREYLKLNPLRMYKFATERDLCDVSSKYSTFASLLRKGDLRPEAEDDPVRIGSTLVQNAVGDYLRSLDATYVPTLEKRLFNDPRATTSLENFSTESSSTWACPGAAFWDQEHQECLPCPSSRSHVILSDHRVDFQFQNNTRELQTGRVVVVNRDLYDFVLVSKDRPDWFEFTQATSLSSTQATRWPSVPVKLLSGEKVALDYAINTSKVGVGVTFGTVYINVSNIEPVPQCFSDRHALALDALIQVTPSDVLVDLGHHATVGIVLMCVVLLTSFGLGLWVFWNRSKWGEYGNLGGRSMTSIQPLYLGTISLGVTVMTLTIAALSVDGGSSGMCLVPPWMLSLGLTVVFAALLSKLTAAQKNAERPNERTIQISYKDLLMPFGILLVINFGILLMMLIHPPTWNQQVVEGEEWKLYGFCDYGTVSFSLLIASGVVHLLTLLYTLYQTYRVSTLSDDFHEIKNIGLAVFVWFQIALVGIPSWFAIDKGNVVGMYYFKVVIICLLSLSMLLCIFVPAVNTRKVADISSNSSSPAKSEGPKQGEMSIFGNMLGLAGSVRKIPEVNDEEVPQEEQNRCLADSLCY